MASDVEHHQHTVRVPASAAMPRVQFNGGQPVIINLGTADVEMPNHAAETDATAAGTAAPTAPVPAALHSMRSMLTSCESILPFVLIILAKLLYDHRLGIGNILCDSHANKLWEAAEVLLSAVIVPALC